MFNQEKRIGSAMEKITNIKIISFRIYGTNDYFSDSDNREQAKCLETIVMQNFPKKDWETSCYFGEIPDDIVQYKHSFDGYNLFAIKTLFRQLNTLKTKEEQLNECITEVKSRSTIFTEYKYYITISIQREIDLKRYKLIKNDNALDVKASLECLKEQKNKMKFPEILDKVVFSLINEIDQSFFIKPIIEENLLILNDVRALGNIRAKMTGSLTNSKPYKKINTNEVEERINKITSSHNNWINSIIHWHLSMLKEKDKWKKFYFGFVFLEIMTHKAFEKIYRENLFDVLKKDNEGYDKFIKIPISDIISEDANKVTLMAKFSFVAGILHPINYSNDLSNFKKCKKIRDKISHGDVVEIDVLPLKEMNSLVEFYSREMLNLL